MKVMSIFKALFNQSKNYTKYIFVDLMIFFADFHLRCENYVYKYVQYGLNLKTKGDFRVHYPYLKYVTNCGGINVKWQETF